MSLLREILLVISWRICGPSVIDDKRKVPQVASVNLSEIIRVSLLPK
jgi:hypothetical protein